MDGVVPIAMEGMAFEVDASHLFVRDGQAGGVPSGVDLGPGPEAGGGRGASDEADDGGQAHQRLAAPVGGDVREEAVFDSTCWSPGESGKR